MKIYEITAISNSGSNVITSDNGLKLNMGSPNEQGVNNPEQLFASAHASCFAKVLSMVSKGQGVNLTKCIVNITVEFHKIKDFDFEFKIGINAEVEGADFEKAKELTLKTHNTCPISKLTKPEQIAYIKVNGTNIL